MTIFSYDIYVVIKYSYYNTFSDSNIFISLKVNVKI